MRLMGDLTSLPAADAKSAALSSSQRASVLASVETRLWKNWEEQDPDSRPSREDYAAEVRNRFGVALSTELASDRELVAYIRGGDVEMPHALHLSMNLMQYYERQEQQARQDAAALFGPGHLDPETYARCASRLSDFVEWLSPRWWLRLAAEEHPMQSQLARRHGHDIEGGEAGEAAWMRMHELQAEHAIHKLHVQETVAKRTQVRAAAVARFLEQFAHTMSPHQRPDAEKLLGGMVEQHWRDRVQNRVQEQPMVERALKLASAARCAWEANRVFELTGALKPMEGDQAQRLVVAVEHWLHEMQQHVGALEALLDQQGTVVEGLDERVWVQRIVQACNFVDVARRSVFQFALDYCGGTRGTVRRRGER